MPNDIFWALVTGIIIGTGISAFFPVRVRIPAEVEEAANRLTTKLGVDPDHVTITQRWEIGLTAEGRKQFHDRIGVSAAIAEEPSGTKGVYHA